jgi:hypothetical protein
MMFIHFNPDKGEQCDNCGTSRTMMHMSVKQLDRTVNFCVVCFKVLAKVLGQAATKLSP